MLTKKTNLFWGQMVNTEGLKGRNNEQSHIDEMSRDKETEMQSGQTNKPSSGTKHQRESRVQAAGVFPRR